jgi:hypothetical protein
VPNIGSQKPKYGGKGEPPVDPQVLTPANFGQYKARIVQWLNAAAAVGKAKDPKGMNDTQLWVDYVTASDSWQLEHSAIQNPKDAAKGTAESVASQFTLPDFITKLFDPALWLRVLEVLAGLILVGIGVSKLSSNGGDALRKIPLYGKAIPK